MDRDLCLVGDEINNILAEVFDIKPGLMNDKNRLEEIVLGAVKTENFTLIGKLVVSDYGEIDNAPKGYTIFQAIGESHILISTYEQQGKLFVNVSSCRGPDSGLESFKYILREVSIDEAKPKYKAVSQYFEKATGVCKVTEI